MAFCHQARILLRLISLSVSRISRPVETNLIFKKHTHRYKDFRISNIGKRNQSKDSAKNLENAHSGKSILKCPMPACESLFIDITGPFSSSLFQLLVEESKRQTNWLNECQTLLLVQTLLCFQGLQVKFIVSSILPLIPQPQDCSLLFKIERSKLEPCVGQDTTHRINQSSELYTDEFSDIGTKYFQLVILLKNADTRSPPNP